MFSRPYVAPADVFARYERSGLVKYSLEETLAVAADIDAALVEMEQAEASAFVLITAACDADTARYGSRDPLWDAYADQYHPELAPILVLLEKAPVVDWGGTGGNCYPLPTWRKKTAAINRYAARLRAAVAKVNTTSRKTAA